MGLNLKDAKSTRASCLEGELLETLRSMPDESAGAWLASDFHPYFGGDFVSYEYPT